MSKARVIAVFTFDTDDPQAIRQHFKTVSREAPKGGKAAIFVVPGDCPALVVDATTGRAFFPEGGELNSVEALRGPESGKLN